MKIIFTLILLVLSILASDQIQSDETILSHSNVKTISRAKCPAIHLIKNADFAKVNEERSLCYLCEYLVNKIYILTLEGVSKDDISNSFDEYNIELLYDLLTSGMNPQQVCVSIYYCSGRDQHISSYFHKQHDIVLTRFVDFNEIIVDVSRRITCTICKLVYIEISRILSEKNVAENLIQRIKNICKNLPRIINEECENFINYYYDMIIMMIEKSEADYMCSVIKMCPSDHILQSL